MAAMNAQQARKYYSKKEPGRKTSYGARPGEITKGLKPGDRWYDAETNTWQLKDGAAVDGGVGSYVDQLMENDDVQGQDRGAGGEQEGSRGSSEGGSRSSQEGGSGSEGGIPSGLEGDDLIKWLIRAGMTAAAAAAFVRARNKGSKGPSRPAVDTAGEADRGGAAEVAPEPAPRLTSDDRLRLGSPGGDGIVDAAFSEVTEPTMLEAPRNALPGPDAAYDLPSEPGTPSISDTKYLSDARFQPDAGMSLGQQPVIPMGAPEARPALPAPVETLPPLNTLRSVAAGNTPERSQGMPSIPEQTGVDASIRQTDPSFQDPDLERIFRQIADSAGNITNPGQYPDLPVRDPEIQRLWEEFKVRDFNEKVRRIRLRP